MAVDRSTARGESLWNACKNVKLVETEKNFENIARMSY